MRVSKAAPAGGYRLEGTALRNSLTSTPIASVVHRKEGSELAKFAVGSYSQQIGSKSQDVIAAPLY